MDWSYVAGFFDGEGCVTCGLTTRQTKTHRNWYPFTRFTITNTNRAVLEAIQMNFSMGTIQTYVGHSTFPEYETIPIRKKAWLLVINKQSDVIKFVDNVYPYSIIKKEQLKLIKEAVEFIQQNGGKKWYAPKLLEFERRFIQANKTLNPNNHGRKVTLEKKFQ